MQEVEHYDTELLREAYALPKRPFGAGIKAPFTAILSPAQPQEEGKDEASTTSPLGPTDRVDSEAQSPPPKARPFWRTTKGILTIGAVVVAAIAGGVVGGVLGSRKSGPSDDSDSNAPVSGDGQAGQNGGPQAGTDEDLPARTTSLPQVTTLGLATSPSTPTPSPTPIEGTASLATEFFTEVITDDTFTVMPVDTVTVMPVDGIDFVLL